MATSEIVARLAPAFDLNSAHPSPEWERAQPIRFSSDWQGKNRDPALQTEVRVLWSPEALYLRFVCRYRELFVFQDSDPNGRRGHLWGRDVAEAFLQPPDRGPLLHRTGEGAGPSDTEKISRFYKEFEVAPNGMWIDLDVSPAGLADLKSGLTRSVHVDEEKQVWAAELAIPMKSLTHRFDPAQSWRANFYRVEGKVEPRRYLAWQSTGTPQPNFHVPERFGVLRFEG